MDKNTPQYTIADDYGWNTCPSCQDIYNIIPFGQEKCKSCGQLFKWEVKQLFKWEVKQLFKWEDENEKSN